MSAPPIISNRLPIPLDELPRVRLAAISVKFNPVGSIISPSRMVASFPELMGVGSGLWSSLEELTTISSIGISLGAMLTSGSTGDTVEDPPHPPKLGSGGLFFPDRLLNLGKVSGAATL